MNILLLFLLFVFPLQRSDPAWAQGPADLKSDPAARDLKSIIAEGGLRVAVTRFKLPGFRWTEGSEPIGPEIDLAQQIGSALGVPVMLVDEAASFDAVVDLVSSGRADIGISKISQTYSRNFVGRIGVISNSAYADSARRNFPDAEIIGFSTWGAAIGALQSDKVDAVYRDEFEVQRILKLNPKLNVKFGAAVVTDQLALLSVAICESCARLQDLINYHLTQTTGSFSLPALLASDLKD